MEFEPTFLQYKQIRKTILQQEKQFLYQTLVPFLLSMSKNLDALVATRHDIYDEHLCIVFSIFSFYFLSTFAYVFLCWKSLWCSKTHFALACFLYIIRTNEYHNKLNRLFIICIWLLIVELIFYKTNAASVFQTASQNIVPCFEIIKYPSTRFAFRFCVSNGVTFLVLWLKVLLFCRV